MGFGRAGLNFGISCWVGYGYWVRGSGPWAVRASKKSARAISTTGIVAYRIVMKVSRD